MKACRPMHAAPVALALLSLSTTWQAKADPINPVVEYSSASTGADSRPFTTGYEFTTSVSLDGNALGYWNDGEGNNHEVGLWTSTGTLLVSTTVLGTDSATGHFLYQPITDITLAPGTYVIGGQFLGNGDSLPEDASGVVTQPGFTWVTDEQLEGSGLNFPTVTTGGSYGTNGILAVDFSTTGTSPVPEPVGVAYMLTAAALIAVGFRRKVSRYKA